MLYPLLGGTCASLEEQRCCFKHGHTHQALKAAQTRAGLHAGVTKNFLRPDRLAEDAFDTA